MSRVLARHRYRFVLAAIVLWALLGPILSLTKAMLWDPAVQQPITSEQWIGSARNWMVRKGWEEIDRIDRTFWARGATNWYASTGGAGTTCSNGSPCTIDTALCNSGTCTYALAPGDNIYLKQGTYSSASATTSYVLGTSGSRITVRDDPANATPCPATGGCGVQIVGTGKLTTRFQIAGGYTTYQGFDVHSVNGVRQTNQNVSFPDNIFGGGIGNLNPPPYSFGIKWVGLVVHNSRNGTQPYVAMQDFEMEGCVIYENGWNDPDDGSGLSIYTQNDAGYKTFTKNVFWGNAGANVQAYGSDTAGLLNYTFRKNSFYADGALDHRGECGQQRNFTFGGTSTMVNPVADQNYFWGCGPTGGSSGSSFLFGYNSSCSGASVTNNYVAVKTQFGHNCTQPSTLTGNTFLYDPTTFGAASHPFNKAEYPSNTYLGGVLPVANVIFVNADDYIPNRGFATVYNWTSSSSVNIDLTGIIPLGANWEIRNTADLAQVPQASGTNYAGGTVSVLMTGLTVATPIQVTLTPSPPAAATTPFPPVMRNPATTGPRFAVFWINVAAGGASTPTPTQTYTTTPTFTNTRTLTPTPTLTPGSATNTPTLTPSPTIPPTSTLTPSPTPTRTATPVPGQQVWSVNDGTCVATAPVVIAADPLALIGGYAASSPTAQQGKIVCTVNVTSPAPQRLWIYYQAPATSADSWYVDIDGDASPPCLTDGDTSCVHIVDISETQQPCTGGPPVCVWSRTLGPAYSWNPLDDRSVICGSCSSDGFTNGVERVLNLTPGVHTISFRAREAGGGSSAKLAYFVLTSDFNYNPAISFQPSPTPAPSYCTRGFVCRNRVVFDRQPCNSIPYPPAGCRP